MRKKSAFNLLRHAKKNKAPHKELKDDASSSNDSRNSENYLDDKKENIAPIKPPENAKLLVGIEAELSHLREKIKLLGGINERKLVDNLKDSIHKSLTGFHEEKIALVKSLSDITSENMELRKKISTDADSCTNFTTSSNLTQKLFQAENKFEVAEASRAMLSDELKRLREQGSGPINSDSSSGSKLHPSSQTMPVEPSKTNETESTQKLEQDLSNALISLAESEASVSVLRELLYEKDAEIQTIKTSVSSEQSKSEMLPTIKSEDSGTGSSSIDSTTDIMLNSELFDKLNVLEQNLIEAEMDLISLRSTKVKLDVSLKKKDEEIEKLNSSNKNLQTQLHEANKKIDVLGTSKTDAEQGLNLLLQENERLNHDLEKLNHTNSRLTENYDGIQSSVNDLQQKLTDREVKYSVLRTQNDSLAIKFERLLHKISTKKENTKSSQDKSSTGLGGDYNSSASFEVTEQAIAKIENSFSECNEKLENVQQALTNKQKQSTHMRSHCGFLVNSLKNAFDVIEDQNQSFGKSKNQPLKNGSNDTTDAISHLLEKLIDLERLLNSNESNDDSKSNDGQNLSRKSNDSIRDQIMPSNDEKKMISKLNILLNQRDNELQFSKEKFQILLTESKEIRTNLEKSEHKYKALRTIDIRHKETEGEEKKVISSLSNSLKLREKELNMFKDKLQSLFDELGEAQTNLEKTIHENLKLTEENTILNSHIQQIGEEVSTHDLLRFKEENHLLCDEIEDLNRRMSELEISLIEKENYVKSLEKELNDLSLAVLDSDNHVNMDNRHKQEQSTPTQNNRSSPSPAQLFDNNESADKVRTALAGLMYKQQEALNSLQDIEIKMMNQLHIQSSTKNGTSIEGASSVSVFDGLTSIESSQGKHNSSSDHSTVKESGTHWDMRETPSKQLYRLHSMKRSRFSCNKPPSPTNRTPDRWANDEEALKRYGGKLNASALSNSTSSHQHMERLAVDSIWSGFNKCS